MLCPFQAGDEAVVELEPLETIRRGTLRVNPGTGGQHCRAASTNSVDRQNQTHVVERAAGDGADATQQGARRSCARQDTPPPLLCACLCCHTHHLRSLRSQKTMSSRPTQFASKTGVGATGLFLCSNDVAPSRLATRRLLSWSIYVYIYIYIYI